MSDIVLSKLLRLVLGLVIVVPRLAWRECPRLNAPGTVGLVGLVGVVGLVGEYTGETGVCGVEGALVLMLVMVPADIAFSSLALTPLGVTGGGAVSGLSVGVVGRDMMALPSSESASKRSGGSRSFSISDLRLNECVMTRKET